MFKKIISFIMSAACTAAVAQTASAWDVSVKTVTDTSGAVQIYRVSEQDKDKPYLEHVYYADENGNKLDGKRLYGNFADEDSAAPKLILADFKNGTANFVTGFTKSSKGRRYYTSGERAYGWKKIDGYWYHFDTKTGYAATGKTKICGYTYEFDGKGRWLKRVSNKGKAPADFSVSISRPVSQGFDTAKKRLYYGSTLSGVQEAKIKIPAADRQILWCMYLESGFEAGTEEVFNEKYINGVWGKLFPKDSGYSFYVSDPETVYEVTVNAGGKTSQISYDTDTEQIALLDEKAFRAALLNKQYWEYYNGLREKYPYTGSEEFDYID